MTECNISEKCGGCEFIGIPYEKQLEIKQKNIEKLLGRFCKPEKIKGMDNPLHYRNKVHHAFAKDRSGNVFSGIYEPCSHRVLKTDNCLLEDEKCQEIIKTVEHLCKSFKIQIYNEDSGSGLLRHVLVRRAFSTGEIMVIPVVSSSFFPSRSNFVKALVCAHPEITTVVINVNSRKTGMVLGSENTVCFGPGYIKDVLCGYTFRISPDSFYQVNPIQTEFLYNTAISYAALKGTETVLDAYCGTGTIGICASSHAKHVIGAELNRNAVKDAAVNARENKIGNIRFICADAGDFLADLNEKGTKADTVFLDPPRSGCSEKFLKCLVKAAPPTVVYISCSPDTLARDLKFLTSSGYAVKKIQPADMFPFTGHTETVVLMTRNKEFVKKQFGTSNHRG